MKSYRLSHFNFDHSAIRLELNANYQINMKHTYNLHIDGH